MYIQSPIYWLLWSFFIHFLSSIIHSFPFISFHRFFIHFLSLILWPRHWQYMPLMQSLLSQPTTAQYSPKYILFLSRALIYFFILPLFQLQKNNDAKRKNLGLFIAPNVINNPIKKMILSTQINSKNWHSHSQTRRRKLEIIKQNQWRWTQIVKIFLSFFA